MAPIRISVSSDHLLVRDALQLLLSSEASFVLAGDEDTTHAPLASPDCDVAIIDSQMEGALVRCANIKARKGPSVVLVGVPDDYDWCMEALRAGARGLVTTRATWETLIRVVHAVYQGGMWVPEHLLVASMRRAATGGDLEIAARLSAREAEVFRLAATGLSNKDLADHLHITEATVKVHLTNIFHKLGLRGRTELAAAYHGILRQPAPGRTPRVVPRAPDRRARPARAPGLVEPRSFAPAERRTALPRTSYDDRR
jgi:DNA-binding NarL/FixJ family response regulator